MHKRVFAATLVAVSMVLVAVTLVAPTVLTQSKITICHTPPGNPDNAQTILISTAALPAHQSHGDTIGECVTVGG